ncbi:MAG: M16 family metallopeptidase [Bacteriovoracaceae bacterium]
MIKKILLLVLGLNSTLSMAFDEGAVKKYNWNGIEVVYLEDNRFPTYSFITYFADGAIADNKVGVGGISNAMFDLLTSGTRRYSQKDISDNLEFFGASYGASIYHEQSAYSVTGLVKDIIPTVKKICHVFRDATFPNKELKIYKTRAKEGLKNLVNSPSSMAHRAFRQITLDNTPFVIPTGGRLKDISKLNRKGLLSQLKYFNDEVKKRIYITGPKETLNLKKVIIDDCKWSGEKATFERKISYNPKSFSGAKIHFVKVPNANQANVIIGRFLNKGSFDNDELLSLTSEYIGGGFTSRLNEEIRVNRNLTYGIYSVISGQKEYGRAIISSSTKNESVKEMIDSIKMVLEQVQTGVSSKEAFTRSKNSLSSSYPFRFEKSSSFLSQLVQLDHVGRAYGELYKFPQIVKSLTFEDVQKTAKDIFDWNKSTILVLGDKKLYSSLKKLGLPITSHKYDSFL